MATCKIRNSAKLISLSFLLIAAIALLTTPHASAQSATSLQSLSIPPAATSSLSTTLNPDSSSLPASPSRESYESSSDPDALLPAAPEPAAAEGREKYNVTPSATGYQRPFSRVGIGVNVNPLGIGVNTTIILNHLYDARFMGNFFNYNSGRFEIEGFDANANLHLQSAAAAFDWYPFASVWRISPGLLFMNGNQLSVTTNITPGTSFTLNNQTFYSATANAATGATPLAASGVLGLHTNSPAFTIAGGFGKYIPRSDRHWSFPSEFGVAFTGAPTVNVNVSGWACLDAAQTKCSNVGDPANPVAIEFNNAVQTSLTKWRKDLALVKVYPLFSYSAVYSFNIRH
jgi:hypothetical protein